MLTCDAPPKQTLVNQLHPAAYSRKEFELALRDSLAKLITGKWEAAAKAAFTKGSVGPVTEAPFQVGDCCHALQPCIAATTTLLTEGHQPHTA